ncbi:hypothetical protein TNCV_4600371 [Trichonephila clavipes]|nr:hypothetical protein TNCV_4600371 [Trichonephila clavipes]
MFQRHQSLSRGVLRAIFLAIADETCHFESPSGVEDNTSSLTLKTSTSYQCEGPREIKLGLAISSITHRYTGDSTIWLDSTPILKKNTLGQGSSAHRNYSRGVRGRKHSPRLLEAVKVNNGRGVWSNCMERVSDRDPCAVSFEGVGVKSIKCVSRDPLSRTYLTECGSRTWPLAVFQTYLFNMIDILGKTNTLKGFEVVRIKSIGLSFNFIFYQRSTLKLHQFTMMEVARSVSNRKLPSNDDS